MEIIYNLNDILFEKPINRGSTSIICCIRDNLNCIAKCSLPGKVYKSFNFQQNALQKCCSIFEKEIWFPQFYDYIQDKKYGDIIIMERIEHLYSTDLILRCGFYYPEIVIKKIAKAIAILHNLGISGYDVEFYWQPIVNRLVVLDIGSVYTFGFTTDEMLARQWELEEKNYMGKLNIISEILDKETTKRIFEKEIVDSILIENLQKCIQKDSNIRHIKDVAQVHALNILSFANVSNRIKYLKTFVDVYKKYINDFNYYHAFYIKSFEEAIKRRILKAEARMYYSKENTLCKETCHVHLKEANWNN